MKDYIFRDLETKKGKEKLIEFLKHQTTAEYGCHQIFNGTRTHIMHNPDELAEFIHFLKVHDKKNKIKKFLEIGYSSGKVNTILNKFFNFEHIVAVDNFLADMSPNDLLANLRRKNLTLICGNSDRKNHCEKFTKRNPGNASSLFRITWSHFFYATPEKKRHRSKITSNFLEIQYLRPRR